MMSSPAIKSFPALKRFTVSRANDDMVVSVPQNPIPTNSV